MDTQFKVAMVLSLLSLLIFLISLIKPNKKVMEFNFQKTETIHLSIPIEGLMKLTGIKFNGTHYNHPKANSNNDIRVVLSELLNWEESKNDEANEIPSGPVHRSIMSDNRFEKPEEDKVEVFRCNDIPAMNSGSDNSAPRTEDALLDYLINKIMRVNTIERITIKLQLSVKNWFESGTPSGEFKSYLITLAKSFHSEMEGRSKAAHKIPTRQDPQSSRPNPNY